MSRFVCEAPNDAWFFRGRKVIVDQSNRSVTFVRCHRKRSFWTLWASEQFECPLKDILAVHRTEPFLGEPKKASATVVTKHGRATIDTNMTGYDLVVNYLERECAGRSGPWQDNPNLILPLLLGFVFVLFGVFLVLIYLEVI